MTKTATTHTGATLEVCATCWNQHVQQVEKDTPYRLHPKLVYICKC